VKIGFRINVGVIGRNEETEKAALAASDPQYGPPHDSSAENIKSPSLIPICLKTAQI
jgi:hypothetical protein